MTGRNLFGLAGFLIAATTAGAADFSALMPPEFAGDRANVETVAVPCRLGDASDYAVVFRLEDALVLKVASVRGDVPAEIAAFSSPHFLGELVEITPVDFDGDGHDELWIHATEFNGYEATWLFAVRNGALVNITPTLRGSSESESRLYDAAVFHAVDGWYLLSWELDLREDVSYEFVYRWREGGFRYETTVVQAWLPFSSPVATPGSYPATLILPQNPGPYVVRVICAHGGNCDATVAVNGLEVTSRESLRSAGIAVSAPVSIQDDDAVVVATFGASDPAVVTVELASAGGAARPVKPFVECVEKYRDGSFAGWFGYDNPNSTVVVIPCGEENQIWPAPSDGEQTVLFLPGKHKLAARAVCERCAASGASVVAPDPSASVVQWKLGALTATAGAGFQPACGVFK
ncbi:MAG: hypothetical protein ABFD84_01995 [Candidatus Polarisedimenticolia bacterium]